MTHITINAPTWFIVLIVGLASLELMNLCLSGVKYLLKRELKDQKKREKFLTTEKMIADYYSKGRVEAYHDCIAFVTATTGYFNGPLFLAFMETEEYKNIYHKYYNYVSHQKAGFRGRIN